MARKVLIVMGSDSDFDQITPAWKVLESLGVAFEVTVASAHRSPERVVTLARNARENGFGVILAAAGGAAHLAGVIAANTTMPVVAVPVVVGSRGGGDLLPSAVQRPGGVPIAYGGIGGARNAGYFAAGIRAASEPEIAAGIEAFRVEQAKNVEIQDARVQSKIVKASS